MARFLNALAAGLLGMTRAKEVALPVLACVAAWMLTALPALAQFPVAKAAQRATFTCSNPEKYLDQVVGDGQCVSFVQAAAGAPGTTSWRAGPRVRGRDIPKGTAIAIFSPGGRYHNRYDGYHAAIYDGQDETGIWVYDQWPGQPVHRCYIEFKESARKPPTDSEHGDSSRSRHGEASDPKRPTQFGGLTGHESPGFDGNAFLVIEYPHVRSPSDGTRPIPRAYGSPVMLSDLSGLAYKPSLYMGIGGYFAADKFANDVVEIFGLKGAAGEMDVYWLLTGGSAKFTIYAVYTAGLTGYCVGALLNDLFGLSDAIVDAVYPPGSGDNSPR
jgi:hypothetical protein